MTCRAHDGTQQTYLVELYRPGHTVDDLRGLAERIREATRHPDGRRVRYLRSTIVPADESLLSVLEAESEELVREAYARAGIPFDRLSAVISDGGGPDGKELT